MCGSGLRCPAHLHSPPPSFTLYWEVPDKLLNLCSSEFLFLQGRRQCGPTEMLEGEQSSSCHVPETLR